MPFPDDDIELNRVRYEVHQFKNHLLTYIAVIGVMFLANVVGGWWWGGNFFFFWVALIWGIVLVVQASRLFGGHIGREWEDRMVDHIMARRKGTYTPYRSAYRPAQGPIVTPPPASEEPPRPRNLPEEKRLTQ